MRAQWWIVGAVTVGLTFAAACGPRPPKHQIIIDFLTPDGAVTDNQPTLPEGKIPDRPYDWQKKPSGNPPKCGPKEVLIKGACFRRAHPDDYSPPCEAPTVQWGQTCYYAIHKAPREPSSIGR